MDEDGGSPRRPKIALHGESQQSRFIMGGKGSVAKINAGPCTAKISNRACAAEILDAKVEGRAEFISEFTAEIVL